MGRVGDQCQEMVAGCTKPCHTSRVLLSHVHSPWIKDLLRKGIVFHFRTFGVVYAVDDHNIATSPMRINRGLASL